MQRIRSTHMIIFTVVLLWIISKVFSAQNGAELGIQDCQNLVPDDYKKHEIMTTGGERTNTTFEIEISNLDEINEANMDFRLDAYIHVLWIDQRLNEEATPIKDNRCEDYIWMPSIEFNTAKSVQTFGKRTSVLLISKEKEVHSIMRFCFKVGCEMNFESYPFDTQKCALIMGIRSNTDDEVNIMWQGFNTFRRPIQVIGEIELLQFYLRDPKPDKLLKFHNGIPFTTLSVNFTFVRRLTGSLVNIYAPSTLIVAVSWVTFWLRLEAAPARVALSVTSLLTLCTQAHQHKSQLPPLNYVTAVDIWLFVCTLMVFASLVEFAIAYNAYTGRKVKESVPLCTCHQDTKVKAWLPHSNPDNHPKYNRKSKESKSFKKPCGCFCFNEENSLDTHCRALFPLSFIVFVIIYWTFYLKMHYNIED